VKVKTVGGRGGVEGHEETGKQEGGLRGSKKNKYKAGAKSISQPPKGGQSRVQQRGGMCEKLLPMGNPSLRKRQKEDR